MAWHKNKVRPPTPLLLESHWQRPYSTPKCNFVLIHQKKWPERRSFCCCCCCCCGPFECIWNFLLCSLDLVQLRQSPPYGCHSLNSYNICLCQTTEFIQRINNKTMATFHFATRLSAQWHALLRLSKHSPRTEWTSYKTPQLSFIQYVRVGLSLTVFLSQCSQLSTLSHVVKSLSPL